MKPMSDTTTETTTARPDLAGPSGESNIAATRDGAANQISENPAVTSQASSAAVDSATAGSAGRSGRRRSAPTPRAPRAVGSGAMGPRMPDDLSAPQREALDRAATDARVTGHRFDLMRYLRLRRTRGST
jgi:hypothetical protein